MASTTKALVSMSLGILVDRDSLSWDDKVIDVLPSFKLSDEYITKDARVKDLLTHNLELVMKINYGQQIVLQLKKCY